MNALRSGLLFSALLALTGATACSNVDNAIDCNAICDRYKDCFDSNYDKTACYDRCRANSHSSTFRDQVDDCHDCIGDKSCSNAAFNCAAECGGVVP